MATLAPDMGAWAVDEAKFMRWDQSAFCRRYELFVEHQKRLHPLGDMEATYYVNPSDVTLLSPTASNPYHVKFDVHNSVSLASLSVGLQLTEIGILRFLIDEKSGPAPLHSPPLYKRFRLPADEVVEDSRLLQLATQATPHVKAEIEPDAGRKPSRLVVTAPLRHIILSSLQQRDLSNDRTMKVIVNFNPFRLQVYRDNTLVQTINGDQLMNFEVFRHKPVPQSPTTSTTPTPQATTTASPNVQPVAAPAVELYETPTEMALFSESVSAPPPSRRRLSDEGEAEWVGFESADGADDGTSDTTASPAIRPTEDHTIDEKPLRPVADAVELDSKDAWEQYFGGETDHKINGPSAIGLDVKFFDYQKTDHDRAAVPNPPQYHFFGLAEHATQLSLPTDYASPYRLFNLDVFEYVTDSPMAIYGAVPLLTAVKIEGRRSDFTAFLWLNPSETWVKIDSKNGAESRFVSETGVMDFMILLGSTPQEILRQYSMATGFPAMQRLFALGAHQSRWNYNDQKDVLEINQGFDDHEFPLDTIWLDIEYTDGKKYFTWHPDNFPEPEKMIDQLADRGRKLVAIIDPHIKAEKGYSVYEQLKQRKMLLQNADGSSTFEGWCWPGNSVYPDFLDASVRSTFADYYLPRTFRGSNDNLHIWNDMNEPSVFNKPEITAPRSARHLDGREHREVHNLYSLFYTKTTFHALRKRNPDRRPFILSRAFFVGSQKYGAIWTGDNGASWKELQIAVPMLLQLSMSGIPMTGADIGGFFKSPDEELFLRWVQQGMWYPFARNHAHIDSKRREPWLFPHSVDRLRRAYRTRYRLIPYLYTLAAESALLGQPIVRPIWWESAGKGESITHSWELNEAFENNHFLVGDSILVRSVNQSMDEMTAQPLTVFLPGHHLWYDLWTNGRVFPDAATHSLQVKPTLDHIPVYIAGGSILVTKERFGRSTRKLQDDPFTILVYPERFPDGTLSASGRIFIDDYDTYEFELNRRFFYAALNFAENSEHTHLDLTVDPIKIRVEPSRDALVEGEAGSLGDSVNLNVERVVVYGLARKPTQATLMTKDGAQKTLEITMIEESVDTEGTAIAVHIKMPAVLTSGQRALFDSQALGWRLRLHH